MSSRLSRYSVTGTRSALVRFVEHEERQTIYQFVLSEIPAEAAKRARGPILLSILSPARGAYAISDAGFLHWSYIKEKFPDLTEFDARVITDLVAEILERKIVSRDEVPEGTGTRIRAQTLAEKDLDELRRAQD